MATLLRIEAQSTSRSPLLSVITPSFQSARFIGETLESVAALDTPHEHVVVDGGSDDGTVELLERCEDPALRWHSEPDRGQTHAVNKGFEAARGDLLAWLNADDAYVPANVDAAVASMVRDPGIGAIFGFTEIVDEQGETIRNYRCGPFSWRRYLWVGEYLPTVTVIFRRSLLARTGGLDERWADAADYDFYLRLLRGVKVVRVRMPLVRFRYHPDSKTASNVELQRREALEIRLGYARNGAERGLMRAIEGSTRLRNAIRSPWPRQI